MMKKHWKFVSNLNGSNFYTMVFQWAYVSTKRLQSGKLTKNVMDLSQHEALKVAHVHEMTLCVTYFAPHLPTIFRFIITC